MSTRFEGTKYYKCGKCAAEARFICEVATYLPTIDCCCGGIMGQVPKPEDPNRRQVLRFDNGAVIELGELEEIKES